MRPLKTSEKRLATAFGAMIFLMANFLILEQLGQVRTVLESEIRNLKLEKTESQYWLSQSNIWTQRKAWLDEKQPKVKGAGQESADLIDSLKQSARTQKITISQQTLSEPTTSPYYSEVAAQLEVKGSFENISHWLASLQQPEMFQAITGLTLKSDADATNIVCNLTVSRWYALP